MNPWNRTQDDEGFMITGNLGAVYKHIRLVRIKENDTTTPVSGRLVVNGNVRVKPHRHSKIYACKSRLLWTQYRQTRDTLNLICSRPVIIQWPPEVWKHYAGNIEKPRRWATGAIKSNSFSEVDTDRWELDIALAITKDTQDAKIMDIPN